MASSQECSKENIYFVRSFLLMIEGGLYISKQILFRECQNPEFDLDELLKRYESKLTHLFHGKQYKKLYPDFGRTDMNSWDLQLTIGVLLNVFGRSIKPVEKQKLRSLRDIRNDIYMHCTSASLDEEEYENVKEELTDIIMKLSSTFEETVQEHCSKCIDKFTKGPLDAVRPSLETLNGFSQKKIKVGVSTELLVCGPTENWIILCEKTLTSIFNHAEEMTSDNDDFQKINKNVQKMLSYLEHNKHVIFKGGKIDCIILCFECEDYESFLHFLEDEESEEYIGHIQSLSDSLFKFFKPKCLISISSRVTTESLQSALVAILKTLTDEEETQKHCIEISSEDNVIDSRAMTTRDNRDEFKVNVPSQNPLLLGLELTSEEGLLHILHSFQEPQFSDSLRNVASSLSSYHRTQVALKLSLNVGDILEAFEESVSRNVKAGTSNTNDYESTAMESTNHSWTGSNNQKKEFSETSLDTQQNKPMPGLNEIGGLKMDLVNEILPEAYTGLVRFVEVDRDLNLYVRVGENDGALDEKDADDIILEKRELVPVMVSCSSSEKHDIESLSVSDYLVMNRVRQPKYITDFDYDSLSLRRMSHLKQAETCDVGIQTTYDSSSHSEQ